jgi:hypothetical protein
VRWTRVVCAVWQEAKIREQRMLSGGEIRDLFAADITISF